MLIIILSWNKLQFLMSCSSDNFQIKNLILFIILLNTDCGYLLEPPHVWILK